MDSKIQWKPLIISILIAAGVGGLSALLTKNNMSIYEDIDKPLLAPPGWLFSVVWPILFLLMGISAYLVYVNRSSTHKKSALWIYGIQLAANMLWSIIFFNMRAYLLSFVWIMVLWVLIIIMIVLFFKVRKSAGYLQIPYLLWVTFAAYLNFGIYLLNQ